MIINKQQKLTGTLEYDPELRFTLQLKPVMMEIYMCACGYTFIIANGSVIPENVVGPIFSPDSVVEHWWMRKPKLMSAHEWYEQYADCAYQWMKAKFQ